MGDEMKEAATGVEAAAEAVPDRRRKPGGYMTFISNSRAGMKQRLRDYAEMAHKMGDIPKPDLVDLMNLFIDWGMSILKKKRLDRVGYH